MTQPQTLCSLLKGIAEVPKTLDTAVKGICLDSRKLKPAELFIAMSGLTHSAKDFVDEAIAKGVSAVLMEVDEGSSVSVYERDAVVIIELPNLKDALGVIAGRFFSEPSHQLSVIGITGTNGKTSVSHYLSQALNYLGCKCGVMGTLGCGFHGENDWIETGHTTPDVVQGQALLSAMRDQGAKAVTMEVSSHGLDQGRVDNIRFSGAVFTNLSHDHLDYHKTMDDYGEAKKRLFTKHLSGFSVINVDDEFGSALAKDVCEQQKLITYGMNASADLHVVRAEYGRFGVKAEISSPWGGATITSKLMGQFNLSNLLAVIGGGLGMGYQLDEMVQALSQIEPVPGRMQNIVVGNGPTVVIDYAHTPDALEKALEAVRLHSADGLWCVFGCGGNRDSMKRAKMGAISEMLADHVVLTDDNARSEAPEKIIDDILSGFRVKTKPVIEHDRAKAIAYAIQNASDKDIVLIAGKGHETYQETNGKRTYFSDCETAIDALANKNAVTTQEC